MADINLNINESLGIVENANLGFTILSINVNDTITVAERDTVSLKEDFSNFLRGYPYVEVSMTKVTSIEFESGHEQILDRWGRDKKQFKITLPVAQKDDATPVRDFYIRNIGKTFFFTEPIDSVRYTVRFADKGYNLERRHYETYFAKITLIEVF